MIRALAIDTATRRSGLALVQRAPAREPRTVAWDVVDLDSHVDRMALRLEELFARAGWARDAPDVYVAVRGPGSFTGVRVGLGTARGLALAAGKPCLGVLSLEALAAGADVSETRLAVVDAGRGELYVGRFAPGFPPPLVEGPCLVARDRLGEVCPEPKTTLVPAAGTEIAASSLPAGAVLASPPACVAAVAGSIALLDPQGREEKTSPAYVRVPDAILNRRRG